MTYDRATHLIRAGDDLLADGIVSKVIPHPLVGIQFRRIGRQEKQTKPLLDGVRFNEPGNAFRPVCRMPVNDQKHHPFGALKQPLDEVGKLRCAHAPFDGHEADFSLCTDRRDNVQAEARPGGAHHQADQACQALTLESLRNPKQRDSLGSCAGPQREELKIVSLMMTKFLGTSGCACP